MSIRNAEINNTILKNENIEISGRGIGITPLDTELRKKPMFCKIAFDYLSFTFPFEKNTNELEYNKILRLLMLDTIKSEESFIGRYGYHESRTWLNEINQVNKTFTTMYSDGPERTNNVYQERTAMFELSGDGCRALENRGGDKFPLYWKKVLESLVLDYKGEVNSLDDSIAAGNSLRHVSVTRIDFAIDVFNASFTLDDIQNALTKRNVLTPFINASYSRGFKVSNLETTLQIIDLGSRLSDCYLCIYDKKKEREEIGKTIEFDSWFRFEFRFKHNTAKNFIINLLDAWDKDNTLGSFASSLVLKYVDIKERPEIRTSKYSEDGILTSKDTMRKWKTSPKWLEFVGTTEKADIVNYFKYESNITKNADWCKRSVAKTLSKLYLSNPDYFYLFILQSISEGYTRFKKNDLEYVKEFRHKHEMGLISKSDMAKMIEDLNLHICDKILIALGLINEYGEYVGSTDTYE